MTIRRRRLVGTFDRLTPVNVAAACAALAGALVAVAAWRLGVGPWGAVGVGLAVGAAGAAG